MLNYAVIPLSMIRDGRSPSLDEAVAESFKNFRCSRSEHIQEFITENVFGLEDGGWVRTFVFLAPTEEDGICVPAFFAIGLTAVQVADEDGKVRGNAKKKLLGGTPQLRSGVVGSYCITDLARSDEYSSEDLPGSIILDEAKKVIRDVQSQCGGRIITVDARPEVFRSLYEPQGFKQLATRVSPNDDEDGEFVVACCSIKNWVATPTSDSVPANE